MLSSVVNHMPFKYQLLVKKQTAVTFFFLNKKNKTFAVFFCLSSEVVRASIDGSLASIQSFI